MDKGKSKVAQFRENGIRFGPMQHWVRMLHLKPLVDFSIASSLGSPSVQKGTRIPSLLKIKSNHVGKCF